MKTVEMKQVLRKKLEDEGWSGVKASDITIRKASERVWWITIKDYENLPFKMHTEEDDYFGNIVWIDEYYQYRDMEKPERDGNVAFVDSKEGYDFRTALVHLGYYIGTRF